MKRAEDWLGVPQVRVSSVNDVSSLSNYNMSKDYALFFNNALSFLYYIYI